MFICLTFPLYPALMKTTIHIKLPEKQSYTCRIVCGASPRFLIKEDLFSRIHITNDLSKNNLINYRLRDANLWREQRCLGDCSHWNLDINVGYNTDNTYSTQTLLLTFPTLSQHSCLQLYRICHELENVAHVLKHFNHLLDVNNFFNTHVSFHLTGPNNDHITVPLFYSTYLKRSCFIFLQLIIKEKLRHFYFEGTISFSQGYGELNFSLIMQIISDILPQSQT